MSDESTLDHLVAAFDEMFVAVDELKEVVESYVVNEVHVDQFFIASLDDCLQQFAHLVVQHVVELISAEQTEDDFLEGVLIQSLEDEHVVVDVETKGHIEEFKDFVKFGIGWGTLS